jgi:type IV secretory pathway VirB2 component (pilin)
MVMKRSILSVLFILTGYSLSWAAGSGMPWEGPLTQIMNSVSGPVSQVIGVIGIVGTGAGVAFSEHGGTAKTVFKAFFGLVIVFTAASFFLGFLGFGGEVGF